MTSRLTCLQVRDIDAELALGIAPGDLREAAIRHLEGCPPCRREIEALAETADSLVHAMPPVDPPAGFESRVLAGIARSIIPATSLVPRRRRYLLALGAAAALVAAAGGGALLYANVHEAPSSAIHSSALIALERTPEPGSPVGAAYLSGTLLVVSVENIGYDGPCTVRVDLVGGQQHTFTGPVLHNGSGTVGITLPVAGDLVRKVTVSDRRGYPMGSARF